MSSAYNVTNIGIISGAATGDTVREVVYSADAGDFDIAVVVSGGGNKEDLCAGVHQ